MKIIISEEKVERISKFLEKSINYLIQFDEICSIKVDYDEQFDKFVFNIFFSRPKAVELGSKLNSRQNEIINQIGNKIQSVLGFEPFMYLHYEDC